LDYQSEEKRLVGANEIFENEKLTSQLHKLGSQDLNSFVSKKKRGMLEINAKRLGKKRVTHYVLNNCKDF
jgi:hypothetical protein